MQKQKLALEREQFDKLQKSKLESAPLAFSRPGSGLMRSRSCIKNSSRLYKERTVSISSCAYFETETQSLRGELEIKSDQIAQELAPRQRKLEDEELGEKGPDLDLLDRQTDLARAGLAQTEVRAPFWAGGSSSSGPRR